MKTIKFFIYGMFATIILYNNAAEHPKTFSERLRSVVPTSVDYISQSHVMSAINNVIAKISCNKGFAFAPALHKPTPMWVQQLWEEAQNLAKIEKKRQISIYELPTIHPHYKSCRASTSPKAAYIKMQYVQHAPYGSIRFTLLHEAQHVLNNDTTSRYVFVPLLVGAGFGAFALTFTGVPLILPSTLPVPPQVVAGCLGLVAEGGTLFAGYKWHSKHKERRSDRRAAELTQCAHCVKEEAAFRKISMNDGYLNKGELMVIADRFEEDGLFCTYHTQQNKEL